MAAPAVTLRMTYRFRDAKGNVGHMKFLFGDATYTAILTDAGTLATALRGVSNCEVSLVEAGGKDLAYGTQATYGSVEDKARLTYTDFVYGLHHFEVPAPKAVIFLADQETVDVAQATVIALNACFTAFLYSNVGDTSPFTYIGGVRTRRKMHRRVNIFTKNPAETGPAE